MFLEKIIENQNKKSSMYMAAKKITRRKQRVSIRVAKNARSTSIGKTFKLFNLNFSAVRLFLQNREIKEDLV
jgi:hypothetical protein